MNDIKIYCEAGAMNKKIKGLKLLKNVTLISYPFENKNKKTIDSKLPSNLTFDSVFTSFDCNLLFSNTAKSELFESIKKIVGGNNLNDVKHIDTAYKENCKIFISPDKDDIVKKGNDIEEITGMKFFYDRDFDLIANYISELTNK